MAKNSLSTGNHTFQTSTGAWVCASSDPEPTGRLVNSYNSGMNEITVGNYFNGDAHAFRILSYAPVMSYHCWLAIPQEMVG